MTTPNENEDGSAFSADDYETIADAVMETPRGRWFLTEFSRRNRAADTEQVLAAIAALKSAVPNTAPDEPTGPQPAMADGVMRTAIANMLAEIADAKREIAQIGRAEDGGDQISDATAELDAVVDATERATSDILEAAEAVQELAWSLREEGVAEAYCDALDLRATEIYTACSFQDITGQRTRRVVRLLQRLEDTIATLSGIWNIQPPEGRPAVGSGQSKPSGADDVDPLLNGPALEGEGIGQDEVDRMLADHTDPAEQTPDAGAGAANKAAAENGDESDSPAAEITGDSLRAHRERSRVNREPDTGEDNLEVPFDALSQADKDALFA